VPNDYPRSHRVADLIQRELSGLIRSELKDPRISPMLTIASVEVSRDLSVAKVYYSLFDPEERQETQDALGRAAGFLRRQLARQMSTRSVPQLRFFYDDSAERGAHMSSLIAKAVASNTTEDDAETPLEDENDSPDTGDHDDGKPSDN
jgi:ribosome-binding factor A